MLPFPEANALREEGLVSRKCHDWHCSRPARPPATAARALATTPAVFSAAQRGVEGELIAQSPGAPAWRHRNCGPEYLADIHRTVEEAAGARTINAALRMRPA